MNQRVNPSVARPVLSERAGITIRRTGVNLGAEISGVDLRHPLPDAQFDAIETALVENALIIFRDQDITSDQLMAFGRRFGELTVHPFAPERRQERAGADQVPQRRDHAAVRHRRLAFRRDVPRRAADGDHPARHRRVAGGRRRHHVRQHGGGL